MGPILRCERKCRGIMKIIQCALSNVIPVDCMVISFLFIYRLYVKGLNSIPANPQANFTDKIKTRTNVSNEQSLSIVLYRKYLGLKLA